MRNTIDQSVTPDLGSVSTVANRPAASNQPKAKFLGGWPRFIMALLKEAIRVRMAPPRPRPTTKAI
jgi:hypothetical protein